MRPGRFFEIVGALAGLATGLVFIIFARDIPNPAQVSRSGAGHRAPATRGRITWWMLRSIGALLILGAAFVVVVAIIS